MTQRPDRSFTETSLADAAEESVARARTRAGRSPVVVLDVLTAVVGLAAIALLVWPARPSVAPQAPQVIAEHQVSAGGVAEPVSQAIVDGNLFSATRRAPTVLFRPPGADGESLPPAPPSDMVVTAESVASGPRLFGIVAQDGVRRALLVLPGADSVPRLLGVGDRQAGYRVVTIGTDRVVLSSSGGTRTVRLVAPALPDSIDPKP